MKRYLVFDAGCSVCNNLATVAQEAADGKLEAINIRGDEARMLLDQAYPEGWEHAPYLVIHHRGRVRASTGIGAAARLGMILGPRKAWRVWSLARQSGVAFPSAAVSTTHMRSRRQLLKLSAATSTAAVWLGWQSASRVLATPCDCSSLLGGTCSSCSGGWCQTWCGSCGPNRDFMQIRDCWDACGDYCGQYPCPCCSCYPCCA